MGRQIGVPHARRFSMPSLTEWKVPPAYQPRPADYSFRSRPRAVVGGRAAFDHSARRLQRGDAGHRTRRQWRVDRRRAGADHRLSDHRSRNRLAASRRRPRGGRPRARLRFRVRLRAGAGAWPARPRSAAARLVRCGAGSATVWWSAAPADARARSRARSRPSRNSPVIGNICWTRRSSPIPRIRTGAAPG